MIDAFDLSQYQLDRPQLLWAAVLVVLFFLLQERGLTGWPRVRLFISTLVRCFAALLLVLALAGPHRFEERPDLSLVFLVDTSGSSSGGRLDGYLDTLDRWWIEKGDVPARVVDAGTGMHVHASPDELRGEVVGVADATPTAIGPGIELALESFEPARSRALVMLTDGAVSDGRAERAASVASIRGVRLYPIPPDEGRMTVAAHALETGDAVVMEGAEAQVVLEVEASDPVSGAVVLIDGTGRELIRKPGIEFEAGPNRVPLSFPADRVGVLTLTAMVEVEGDLFADDDVAYGALEVIGTPRALIAADRETGQRFARVLSTLESPPTHEIVSPTLETSLEGADLLVWIDPGLKGFEGERVERLRTFVRKGGRLLIVGGEQGLQVADDGQDEIKELLPVRFPKTERKEPAPLIVIYCVDRSDSMGRAAKFEIALTAVAESIALLDPESLVGVVTFSDLPRWAVPVTPAGELETIRARLAELTVAGGTSIYPAIQEGYEALIDADAKLKHIILLSDGQSTSRLERDGEVVHNVARRKFTLSTVAIGREADQKELKAVADIGQGRYYYTEDFATIPQILLDETMTVVRSNKIDTRIDVHAVDGSRFLAGIDGSKIPDLQGYVRSRQKTTTELALATERGEPLLVSWHHGRGVVTLFTSDFDGPWSAEWADWKQRSAFWRGVIRETLSPLPAPDVGLEARVVDGELRLSYSILDTLKNPRNDLTVAGRVTGPDGVSQAVSLAPAGPGRYSVSLPVTEAGGYMASVDSVQRRAGALEASGGVVPGGAVRASAGTGHPAETRAGTLNLPLLRRLAEVTGGQLSPGFADVLEEGVEMRLARIDSWPPLLWAALVLFGIDLAIRRLVVPRWLSRVRRSVA